MVNAKNSASNPVVLQTAWGSHAIFVNVATVYANFPATSCAPAAFACLSPNQIVSVDTNLLPSITRYPREEGFLLRSPVG